MGVTKKAIYPKYASQICYKEGNFIFASSCFGKRIPTQNQQTKNVCADLFCIVLYCIVMKGICEECKKLEKKPHKNTHKKHSKNTIVKTFKI